MKKTYSTSQVAARMGIHPNTVRLYEELRLITAPERKANGYRVFTDLHIQQFGIARLALEIEVIQNGLRKQALAIVHSVAAGDLGQAAGLTSDYIARLTREEADAEKAILITEQIQKGLPKDSQDIFMTRRETADYLHITIDTLRNWELNGLITVKRRMNGYRVYTDSELRRLTIIKSLRYANFSLAAILRMLSVLDQEPEVNIRTVIDTPDRGEEIITTCDNLLTSLAKAKSNAQEILDRIRILNDTV